MPCDMHQGDKVGSSSVGELAIIKDNFATNAFPYGTNFISKLLNMVKYFEANPTNRRKKL